MLTILRGLVEAESPSTDKASVDRVGKMLGEMAQSMNANVRYFTSRMTGNHLRAEFRFGSRTREQILLLGHMDTVWDLGTIHRMPFRLERGRAFGPGVFDMKSGIVSGIFALKTLQALQIPIKAKIVLLLNADEEIGSPTSRAIIEREARRSDCVLVLESAQGRNGALKTARKGVGEFDVRVIGRAAHAGIEPEKGASAVVELCRQILSLEQFADRFEGATVNAGVISGGARSNVIPAEALVKVDVRVARKQDMAAIERQFQSLKPYDRRTTIQVTGGFNRPPLERTPQVVALFERARAVGRRLGMSLPETCVGGGSDGNFTAALGIPTLDGLGAIGDGAHALHEHIVVAELPRRSALLAHLIADLASEPRQ